MSAEEEMGGLADSGGSLLGAAQTERAMVGGGLVCVLLGVASVALNALVVATLARNAKILRKNVFYLIG